MMMMMMMCAEISPCCIHYLTSQSCFDVHTLLT